MGLGLDTAGAAAAVAPRLLPDVLLRRERVSLSLSEPTLPEAEGVDGREIASKVELRRRAVPMRADHLLPLLGEASVMVVRGCWEIDRYDIKLGWIVDFRSSKDEVGGVCEMKA
jgi:hypothetical protein